jgi:hypothetical protein
MPWCKVLWLLVSGLLHMSVATRCVGQTQRTVCTRRPLRAPQLLFLFPPQAFSESQIVNDGMGFLLHSLLLVPYYSWKHSHRRHHSNTASIDKDEVFVPVLYDEAGKGSDWDQIAVVR